MQNTDEIFDSVEGLFDEFDDNGYQAESEDMADDNDTDSTAEDGDQENTHSEGQEKADGEDSSGEESDEDAEEVGTEGQEGDQKEDVKPSFANLKVNGEIRSCSYEDAPAWIQKGMDYDRVKGQLETERQTNQSLQAQVDKQKPFMEMLENAAENSNMTIEQLVETIQINLRMSRDGSTEKEARAEIRAEMAERKVEALTKKPEEKKETAQEPDNRADREIAEFAKNFPGVQLTDEQIDAMRPDVLAGMTMTNAYLKMENKRLQAEIENQKQQREADAKNKKNRARSPGSQKDAGGGKMDDLADIFEKELFK